MAGRRGSQGAAEEKKGAEEEESNEEEFNPFEDKDEGWHSKRKLLNMFQSSRQFRKNTAPPKLNARQFARSRSLPNLPLLAKKDPETLEYSSLEPSYFPMAIPQEVQVKRRGRLSLLASGSEDMARQLHATLEPLAQQEEINEMRVPNKLHHWKMDPDAWEFDLSQKSLMADDFYFLGHALRFNILVRKLDLSRCFVADDDLKVLVDSLEFNICLEELLLFKTRITDEGAALIADMMAKSKTLTTLDVRQTMLTGAGGEKLIEACQNNENLRLVNGIDVHALREFVPDELDYQESTFGAAEVVLLRHLVQGKPNVRTLNLRKNMLGPKSVPVLMGMLGSLPRLTDVVLRENRIGCQGAEGLAELLLTNLTLLRVDVSKNGLMLVLPQKKRDLKGVKSLVDALFVNKKLQSLNHAENDMDEDVARQINERVMVNRALTHTPHTFEEHLDTLLPPQVTFRDGVGGFVLDLNVNLDFLAMNQPRMTLSHTTQVTCHDDQSGGTPGGLGFPADGFVLHPKERFELAQAAAKEKAMAEAEGVSSAIAKYTAGCDVMCRWSVDGRLYPARVTGENMDRTFNVRFLDGTVVSSVPRADLRLGHRTAAARFDP